jgi:hypothetical protein
VSCGCIWLTWSVDSIVSSFTPSPPASALRNITMRLPQLTTPPHHPQQLPQLPLLQVCVTGMGRWADRLGLPIIAAAPAHHTCLPRGASPSPPSVVGQGPRSSVRGSQYIS